MKLHGELFEATVFRVISRKEDGSPYELIMMGPDDTAELDHDQTKNCFLVGYLPKSDHSEHAGEIPAI